MSAPPEVADPRPPEHGNAGAREHKPLQPHQITLWVWLAMLFGLALLGNQALSILGVITTPHQWLMHYMEERELFERGVWATLTFFGLGGLILYLEVYIPVKLWAIGSRKLRWVLAGYVVVCLATWWAFTAYRDRVDWTLRGLNPDRPGFEPQVVILAGEVTTDRGRGRFEIRMRGWDCYYKKEWHGKPPQRGSWTRTEIAWDKEGYSFGRRYTSIGSKGGGGGINTGPQAILVARRLWDGDRFVGAQEKSLSVEDNRVNGKREEFADLAAFGRWQIPRRIVFSQNDWNEVYHVKRVEFWTKPNASWFEKVMHKYRDHDPDLQREDLGEPASWRGPDRVR